MVLELHWVLEEVVVEVHKSPKYLMTERQMRPGSVSSEVVVEVVAAAVGLMKLYFGSAMIKREYFDI